MQASYAEKVIFLRETLSSGRNSRIQKLLCAGVSLHLTLHVVPKTGQGEFERRNFTMVSEQKIDLSVGSRNVGRTLKVPPKLTQPPNLRQFPDSFF